MLGLGLKVRGCFWTRLDRESEDLTVSCLSPEPDDVRLEGGDGRCAGGVELKHQGEWRGVGSVSVWDLRAAAVVCRQLDWGSAVSTGIIGFYGGYTKWVFQSHCVGSESALKECGTVHRTLSPTLLEVTCSGNTHIMLLYSADGVGSHTLLSLNMSQ